MVAATLASVVAEEIAASVEALPVIAGAVDRRAEVILNGEIRRGADAVAVGRFPLWSLVAGGQEGVEAVLRLLEERLDMRWPCAG